MYFFLKASFIDAGSKIINIIIDLGSKIVITIVNASSKLIFIIVDVAFKIIDACSKIITIVNPIHGGGGLATL